jgi:hypothetical protein
MPHNTPSKKRDKDMTSSAFMALPDAEKDRIWEEIDSQVRGKTRQELIAMSKPLNARQRSEWRQIKKKIGRGRPPLGAQGTEKVSISVEKSLLAKADAFARKNQMTRSQLFVRALQAIVAA